MQQSNRSVTRSDFGVTGEGEAVTRYTLANAAGLTVDLIDYGGIVTSITAPDREGRMANVVLSYDTLTGYEADPFYLGALIGRYSNRIAGGQFQLDGKTFKLAVNNGPNHLHGGVRGFNKSMWEARISNASNQPELVLRHTSPDGDEGYPGTLEVEVTYRLLADNALEIEYRAITDKATPVNLTSHAYFNLCGDARRDILGHELQINASRFLPIDASAIPAGSSSPVADTPFDFRRLVVIGARIDADNEQLRRAGGYDHTWIPDEQGQKNIAGLYDPQSGRYMTVWSTEPGLQFYSGNFLDGTDAGGGIELDPRHGVCLETQHFPDSPNRPDFPSTILRPGEVFSSTTRYQFQVKD